MHNFVCYLMKLESLPPMPYQIGKTNTYQNVTDANSEINVEDCSLQI